MFFFWGFVCSPFLIFFCSLTMESLRALLALLCVFLAGAQTQTQRNMFAGKFAKTICCTFQENALVCIVYGTMLHVKLSFCV